MSTPEAIPVTRGCGTRVAGGIYAECGLSADGLPLEFFITDPPIAIDPQALGVSPVGVTLIDVSGTTHIFDWIGSQHYPNVADYVEETRRFGASRRLPKTLDFSRLTSKSRMILIHARTIIGNWSEFLMHEHKIGGATPGCPKGELHRADTKENYSDTKEQCARFWWQDVEPTGPGHATIRATELMEGGREITRRMPSFSYTAWRPFYQETGGRQNAPGIFMSLPIHRLVVVKDAAGGTHTESHEKAKSAGVPVDLEEQ